MERRSALALVAALSLAGTLAAPSAAGRRYHALITGANSGLGLELVKQYAAKG
jgi:hypothetical protein